MDFQDLMEKIGRLPRAQRLGGMVLLYVILGVVFWFLLYSPKLDNLAQLQTEQADLVKKKNEVQARAADKEKFEKDLEELTARLQQALRQLPDERDIPDLLTRISTVARRIGLEIIKWYSRDETVREYYADVPVQMEIAGSYHEVAMFFDRLSKLSRIVYVEDIEMTEPKEAGGKVQLKVSGTLKTFRFLSEEERKKRQAEIDAAAQGGRKRR